MKKIILSASLLLSVLISCNDAGKKEDKEVAAAQPVITGETVNYAADTVKMQGYIAFDSANTAKRPAVLVVPEWWGIGDYVKGRAKQLAELGYIAMAVDMYGNATEAADPETAGKMAMPFYTNPQMAKARFDAALAKLKTYPQVDTNRIAAIGYCFGGSMVLNAAKMGAPLVGVVSFHGGLAGVTPDKATLKAKVLVCHGGADNFESPEEIATFKKQMDSVGADYTFKVYEGATHAFTNPEATEKGKKFNMPISYNAAADTASWNDMKAFFGKIFK
jgi:dienelactone hydrolase